MSGQPPPCHAHAQRRHRSAATQAPVHPVARRPRAACHPGGGGRPFRRAVDARSGAGRQVRRPTSPKASTSPSSAPRTRRACPRCAPQWRDRPQQAARARRQQAAQGRSGRRLAKPFTGKVCTPWPRGDVPAAFYTIPASKVPVLLLSGGLDPVTPPRHAERVARALGPQARSVVVANNGHGVSALPCMRDAVFRFMDEPTSNAQALAIDVSCATRPAASARFPAVAAGARRLRLLTTPATSTTIRGARQRRLRARIRHRDHRRQATAPAGGSSTLRRSADTR